MEPTKFHASNLLEFIRGVDDYGGAGTELLRTLPGTDLPQTLPGTDLPQTLPAAGRAVGCIHKDVTALWLNHYC